MNKQEIATFVHFHSWANGRVLNACQQLTQEQFISQLSPAPGWNTLQALLVHMLDTEYGWRLVLQGQDASDILKAADFPTPASLITSWKAEQAAWFAYIDALSDQQLQNSYGVLPHQNTPKTWQTIMHVMAHAIQHRSEAAFILTGYGHSPGELDFHLFLQENPPQINNDGSPSNPIN